MKNNFALTRLLYIEDEVAYMCLLSLLQHDSKQALFWFNEYYFTNYETSSFQLLYTIYMTFYSFKNPMFDDYLEKHEENYINLMKLVSNMASLKYSFTVFIMYNCINSPIPIAKKYYKGRKPRFLEKYSPNYHFLIQSINKKDYENICAALQSQPITEELYNVIIDYYENVENVSFNGKNGYKLFSEKPFQCSNLKYILSIICLCDSKEPNICTRNLFKKLSHEQCVYLDQLRDYKELFGENILHRKREYGVSNLIGLFELNRRSLSYDSEKIWYILTHNWLYYAAKTPLWKRILNDVNEEWNFDHIKKTISMTNEEYFYEQFSLHHDEQCKAIQDMALAPELKKISIQDFCKHFNQDLPFTVNIGHIYLL
tara:strand:- start:10221 stop:11333 length:1113 start_codon:yes stop_codon:yes gene_type:complete